MINPPKQHESQIRLQGNPNDSSFRRNALADNPMAQWVAANSEWEWNCIQFVIDGLECQNGHVTLLTDDPDLPPKDVNLQSLKHIDSSRLKLGIFDTLDYRLEALRKYDRAKILVQECHAQVIRAVLLQTIQTLADGESSPMSEKAVSQRIIAAFDAGEKFTKADMQNKETANGMAVRAFQRAWDMARQERPDLGKPGRKS